MSDFINYVKRMNDKGVANKKPQLQDYLNHEFQSACIRTNDYISFEKKYRNYLKKNLPDGFTIHSFNGSHFEFSCVIETPEKNFIYMSISDVRFFPNEWFNNILIRTMKHDKDWSGGNNHFTTLDKLNEDILHLANCQKRNTMGGEM